MLLGSDAWRPANFDDSDDVEAEGDAATSEAALVETRARGVGGAEESTSQEIASTADDDDDDDKVGPAAAAADAVAVAAGLATAAVLGRRGAAAGSLFGAGAGGGSVVGWCSPSVLSSSASLIGLVRAIEGGDLTADGAGVDGGAGALGFSGLPPVEGMG